jgi:receptor protein-tyrosine kinase/non-specific protein-tyrosine kinase
MSKIEEALEKANKLRQEQFHGKLSVSEPVRFVDDYEIKNEFIITPDKSDTPIAEEYRRLKSMLIRETKSDFNNSVMITSSVEGEGKTLTAINLAIAIAQEIDHSVLLIDADLRNPMVHKYLEIEYKYGLNDFLSRDIDVSELFIKTGLPHLKVIPAGERTEHASELLASSKMKSLMHELKKKYMDRYIIVDTPPIASFADAITIGSYVDGIIFVVKERGVKHKTIEESLGILKSFKILGVVFNNVSDMNRNGRYSRYTGYSYKSKK